MSTIMITGGCGFIGHHFVEHFLKHTTSDIVVLDKLTYAANGFERLRDIEAFTDSRVKIFTCDLASGIGEGLFDEIGSVNYILHLAAETHVDRSILEPLDFIVANVLGTYGILEYARQLVDKYPGELLALQYFSTDEVFGPALMPGKWVDDRSQENGHNLRLSYLYAEWDRYNSTNPYSATKAGGGELALAYANTYGIPLYISYTMNNFGERQHPEKYIPLCIRKILKGEQIQIHASRDKKESGRRSYIHCRNVADATHFLMGSFKLREKYNIVGEQEVSNLELAQIISDILAKPLYYELVDFHSSRPGHDLRYGLCGRKMESMGWKPPVEFRQSLERTIEWMLTNDKWLWFDTKGTG